MKQVICWEGMSSHICAGVGCFLEPRNVTSAASNHCSLPSDTRLLRKYFPETYFRSSAWNLRPVSPLERRTLPRNSQFLQQCFFRRVAIRRWCFWSERIGAHSECYKPLTHLQTKSCSSLLSTAINSCCLLVSRRAIQVLRFDITDKLAWTMPNCGASFRNWSWPCHLLNAFRHLLCHPSPHLQGAPGPPSPKSPTKISKSQKERGSAKNVRKHPKSLNIDTPELPKC